jgi:hypothetical protein
MLSQRLCLCYHGRQSLLEFIPIQSMGTRKRENEKIQSMGTRKRENEKIQSMGTRKTYIFSGCSDLDRKVLLYLLKNAILALDFIY